MNSNNLRMNGQHFHPISPSFSQQYRQPQQPMFGNPVGQTYTAFHNTVRIDRPMYSSTIQPTTSQGLFHSQTQGLGALEKMGRFIKEETDPKENVIKMIPAQGAELTKPLTFRMDRNPRVKMAASSIFTSKNTQNSMVFSNNENNVALSKLNALMTNKKIVQVHGEEVDQPLEEQRKREILSFKSEGDILNKKIQNTFGGISKNGEYKPYFQLPSRKNQRPTPNQGILQVSSLSTNQVDALKVKENTKPSISHVQVVSIPFTTLTSNQQEVPTLQAAKEGMFKKKTPYISQDPSSLQNRPLAKIISIKSQKVIKKICKSDFIIGKKMGKGQFGEVMMVIHRETGFLCAMKVMSKKQIREEKYVNQVARELSIQFYLNHRYIAPLYGYFEDEDNVYLLVQFCADGQLLQKMRKSHRLEDPETSPIIRQVCEGLNYIHKEQILHRDIKPQNILFQFGTVKISDFGWAVYSGNEMRRTVSGTPLYYCPELVLETEYDEKIDIWSIGMMTYQCLIGKIPFKIYSEFDLKRIVTDEITFPEYVDVTDQAKDFILSSMRKKAEQRIEIREMLRHPFITKYMKNRGADEECLKEMRRILNG